MDETLTGTTTLGQSGTGSNDNEGKLPEMELHYQMQLSVIHMMIVSTFAEDSIGVV